MNGLEVLPTSGMVSLQNYQKNQVSNAILALFDNNPYTIYSIIDATCHIGGDAINFANTFPNADIICIDNDFRAIQKCRKNVQLLNLENRFHIYYMDCIDYLNSAHEANVDILYFDPPWGGYGYVKSHVFDLSLGGIDISIIINYCLTFHIAKNILIKVPRNFNIEKFLRMVNANISIIHIYKPHKNESTDNIGSIAYSMLYIN